MSIEILPTRSNGLGLAVLKVVNLQLWERMADSDNGSLIWVLMRTIELDKILSPEPMGWRVWTKILAFDEETNTMFVLWDGTGFMIQLQSLKFRKVLKSTTRVELVIPSQVSLEQPCMAWVSDGNETESVLLKLKLKSPITEMRRNIEGT
ncbi:hypothetical protein C2845_PM02G17840 [Panicum miliaceum]|uniref:Uncharacterized protein n=1 Tax=Panicum miliaceum TaxID=4540 RepID=A0A3L6SBB2_PANMI|nr:hypothetical protein C2845_PM02G17840 [Panicum miliaceum]